MRPYQLFLLFCLWLGPGASLYAQNPTAGPAQPDTTKRFIRVVAPGKGAKWDLGTTNRVEWVSNFADSVQIELYRNEIFYGMLTPSQGSQVGDNQWAWSIPMNLRRGSGYQVQVINKNDKSTRGKSEPFAVRGEFRWKRFAIIVGGAAVITTTAALLLTGNRDRNLPEPPLPEE
jgi:hypothetical protein